MIAKIGSISAVLLMLSMSVTACGKEPEQTAAPWKEIWVPHAVDPRVPAGSRRLTTDELRTILPGKMLVPVERIPNRWDECNEYFSSAGYWKKCANPASVEPEPYGSYEVLYRNDMFCVKMYTFNILRCSYIYKLKENEFYIQNFYEKKESSLLKISMEKID